ncbi:hypothetical protein A943_12850 [Bacillus sp. CPSM8]|nr:hypothetical protein A943_12850 [Bacillus sp. CPSM8]KUL17457.1 hypothetical protein LI6934_10720 [Bacillus licheniformis LMG 6934]
MKLSMLPTYTKTVVSREGFKFFLKKLPAVVRHKKKTAL